MGAEPNRGSGASSSVSLHSDSRFLKKVRVLSALSALSALDSVQSVLHCHVVVRRMPGMKEPNSDDAIRELQTWTVLSIAGIAKLRAEETGEKRGVFLCPACRTGQLRWSIASNGHVRVLCDRKCADNSSCINAQE